MYVEKYDLYYIVYAPCFIVKSAVILRQID